MKNFSMTLYFSNGKTMILTYSEDSLLKQIEVLKKGWDHCYIVCEEYGVNFSLVTHYEVKEI